jgi:hypothetical protein
MKVVTSISDATHPAFLSFLSGSCSYHGLELVVLQCDGDWVSHRLKDALLLEYVSRAKPDDILLFSDGYDAILMADETEIMTKYEAFGTALVFSAEKNCWPYRALSSAYPESPTALRFLNCGGFMGTAAAVYDVLTRFVTDPPTSVAFVSAHDAASELIRSGHRTADPEERFRWSNQYLWTLEYLRHPELISLDHHATLFLTLSTIYEDVEAGRTDWLAKREDSVLYLSEMERLRAECRVRDDRLIYNPTKTAPSHVHFSSPVVKLIAENDYFREVTPWLRRQGATEPATNTSRMAQTTRADVGASDGGN